jgi:hypothetical protein
MIIEVCFIIVFISLIILFGDYVINRLRVYIHVLFSCDRKGTCEIYRQYKRGFIDAGNVAIKPYYGNLPVGIDEYSSENDDDYDSDEEYKTEETIDPKSGNIIIYGKVVQLEIKRDAKKNRGQDPNGIGIDMVGMHYHSGLTTVSAFTNSLMDDHTMWIQITNERDIKKYGFNLFTILADKYRDIWLQIPEEALVMVFLKKKKEKKNAKKKKNLSDTGVVRISGRIYSNEKYRKYKIVKIELVKDDKTNLFIAPNSRKTIENIFSLDDGGDGHDNVTSTSTIHPMKTSRISLVPIEKKNKIDDDNDDTIWE